MVRRLPWEQAANNGTLPLPSSTPARSRRSKPILDSSDIELSPQNPLTSSIALSSGPPQPILEHRGHRHARSASPPLSPPEEAFMIDGFRNDDKYRMVEDEFLDVAKEYTQHLHAAEYLRLKAAARNKCSATEVSRPVVGAMPDATKRKLESIERAKKQAEAVAKLKKSRTKMENESDPETPEPWLGTALHGLMEEAIRPTSTITDVVEMVSTSKAAKGFKGNKNGRIDSYELDSGDETDEAPFWRPAQIKNEVGTESENDDLDAPVLSFRKQKLPVASSPSPLKKKENKTEFDLPSPPRRNLLTRTTAPTLTPTPPPTNNAEPPDASVTVEEREIAELPRTSADILARMAKRRELTRRKREREEEEAKREELAAKKRKESVIPAFL